MKQNSKRSIRNGFTLVEVLIAILLVGVAAAVVYTELIASYRILMRSRAKLEAQGLAFDKLWEVYNLPMEDLPEMSDPDFDVESTPVHSVLSTNAVIVCKITTETNAPTLPDPVYFWDIYVRVWATTNSPINFGGLFDDRPLASYQVRRYDGNRQKGGNR